MRTTVIVMLACMVSCACIAEDKLQSVNFEFGASFNAVLSDTLDARKTKPGDPVRAKASEDIKSGGLVVIPRGTRLVGQVTEAHTAPRNDGPARLGVEFDRAELKDGRKIPLHTTFYALAAPVGASSDLNSSSGGGFGSGFGVSSTVDEMMTSASHTSSEDASSSGAERAGDENLKPSSGAIGGLNGSGMLYASSRGVFGLEGISLEPPTTSSAGSAVILANAKTVHLSRGTRMLLSVEATAPGAR